MKNRRFRFAAVLEAATVLTTMLFFDFTSAAHNFEVRVLDEPADIPADQMAWFVERWFETEPLLIFADRDDFERVCDEAALPTGLRAELRGQFQPLLTRRQSTRPMINLKPYVFADSEQNISRYFPDGRYRLYVHRPRGPGDPAGEVTGDTRRFIRHEHPELEYADIGYKISASRTRRRSALANLSNAPLTDTQVHDLRRLVTDPRALDVRDQVTARLNAYARSAGNEDYLVQAGSCRGMITRPTRRA